MIAVVAGGDQKRGLAQPARSLYVGPYYTATWDFARSLLPLGQVFILSRRYGLIANDQVIGPYEVRRAPFSLDLLREQARSLGLTDVDRVISLGGLECVAACRGVWGFVRVVDPCAGLRRGEQMRWLRDHAGVPWERW